MRNEGSAHLNRRSFIQALTLGAGTLAASAADPPRRLKIGHTGITWGNDIGQAIQDTAGLGYYGFETFGNVLETWEAKGGLARVLDENKLPLISAYCSSNLTDPTLHKTELEKMLRWGNLLKKCGGSICVLGPNSIKRDGYDFKMYKSNIVNALNETAKALADIGVTGVLHQHTGTCVMVRDEVYGVMDAVDTRYVKFGPDIGQLAAGGNDPAKVVKDFLPLVRHVHLKDYSGGEHYLGYAPLGRGKVDIPAILDILEKSDNSLMIMAELDPSPNMPQTPLEVARINKAYMEKLGYKFRS